MKTNRLFFRPFQEGDAYNLFLLNLNPKVIQYTGDKAFESELEALSLIQSYDHYGKYGMGRWIIETKDSFIGWCGLKTNKNGEIDLGFRILEEFWGLGYGTEAGKACLNYGFNKLCLEKIIAKTGIQNIKAQNLISKLGMIKEGITEDDKIGPVIKYYITRDKFKLELS